MKKGLFSKMITAYTIIIAVSFVAMSGILSIWFQRYYFDQKEVDLERASQLLQPSVEDFINGFMSDDMLSNSFDNIGSSFNVKIVFVDRYGYANAFSSDYYNNKSIINKQIITDDLNYLRSGSIVATQGGYEKFFGNSVNTYIFPLFNRYNVFEGALMMNTPISEINKPIAKVYEIIWMLAIIAIIVPCFIIYYFSQRMIIKPLAEINNAAEKISKGEIDKRVKIQSDDEIGDLTKSFNSMADTLAKVEENRRDFVSNVSHEIRSPITSIKGFIGGIMDGVIPPEKEKYYLSLAYDETQRLTRLVNDLLDLSTIDAGQLSLNIIRFDVNEVIRRTIIKFEDKVRDRKLKVDVMFSSDELFVLADLDKITQVITNLFDNAIKYVLDEGNIKIVSKTKGDKVNISIYNDCEPLSEEELKHIWDRFYKRDKSRTIKVSTGLGLPIVQSILAGHGEEIRVENSHESGIEFIFTLKRG
jgi:signal transduction histidine kinase